MININKQIWTRSQEKAQPGSEIYYDGKGIKLVSFKIGYDKELYPLLGDIDDIRKYYRTNYAINKIGLIECDLMTVAGNDCVRTVSKRSQANMPNWYMASLSIPLKKSSYVLTLYSEETGTERLRENAVLKDLRDNSEVEMDEQNHLPKNWMQDPYAEKYYGPSLYNLSDNDYYDRDFPDHALSKLRVRLNELAKTIEIPIDNVDEGNPWWKIW